MKRLAYIIATAVFGVASACMVGCSPAMAQDQVLTPVLVDSIGVIVKPNATALAVANGFVQNNAVSFTNVVISADAKTNTIIVINGQITSWVVTE